MNEINLMKKLQNGCEIERLKWFIDKIPRQVKLNQKEKQKTQIFPITASSLFRLAGDIGLSIILLLENNHIETSVMLERNLYELWCEFRYLNNNSEKGSVKAHINSAYEYIDFFKLSKGFKESDKYKDLMHLVEYLGKIYPTEKREVEQQRKNYKFHWSGISKTKMIKSVAADGNISIYRLLSWETHAVMTSLRDLTEQTEETTSFKDNLSKIMSAQDIAFRTTGCLYYFWYEYAETFGLDIIKIEECHSS